jgi:putative SOS response-associated peptidase YedK
MFHSSFSGRHCLVITDGFYEWKTVAGKKQPYRFVMKSREPFAMAGIYARDHDDHSRYNFAILTKDANEIMAPVHDRMPVILPLGEKNGYPPKRHGDRFRVPARADGGISRHAGTGAGPIH